MVAVNRRCGGILPVSVVDRGRGRFVFWPRAVMVGTVRERERYGKKRECIHHVHKFWFTYITIYSF